MADIDLVLLKASNVRRHLERVAANCDDELDVFLSNQDHQDIVCFNLQLAIQNCIDIAAHMVSVEGTMVPGSVNEMFYFLEEKGILPAPLVEKMVKAVGFRNLLVHEYGKLDLAEVFKIAHHHAADLNEYLLVLFHHLGVSL